MSRKDYLPTLVAVYLDNETLAFLNDKPYWDLWKKFLQRVDSLFPNITVHIRVDDNLLGKLKTEKEISDRLKTHTDPNDESDFLKEMIPFLPASKFQDPDWDEVCFLYLKGISPLLDVELSKRSWKRHQDFFSQYSYSENLPEGIIPTILSREFLSTLPDKLPSDVHSFFLKNINHYDVDIFFVPPDLRQYRFDLRVNHPRNVNLIESLFKKIPGPAYSEILPILKKEPAIFRFAPSYVEWEIQRGSEQDCIFRGRTYLIDKNDKTSVTLENAKLILSKLESTFPSPMTICLGGNGEPLLHPDWKEIITRILKLPYLTELMIETSLTSNAGELVSFLRNLSEAERKKICLIVDLSTLKEDRYKTLYGTNDLSKVLESIDLLKSVLPQGSLNVEMIKMKEVEDEIDAYFTYFEKKNINVILQKYNSYAGKLTERRVSDLTPIHREFCWHLTRDLYINANGSVAICKQDITREIGNLTTENLKDIWQKGNSYFASSFLGNHPEIPAPCLSCDEWYTFNA
ncbi:spiro-SPASM protein [Leptospira ilyithenensis]|uniref:Spiro-SPASM protein n=1 Tax=Leptospira ilyithenensis TaxID=2484901 RepID=A0A4R9LIP0_9LEPT|nr:spiro-SPASM protein [Leptospira ilyithenensis]TGN06462.1 spiro-SPASM protein [Leptospira ilyithenensis]